MCSGGHGRVRDVAKECSGGVPVAGHGAQCIIQDGEEFRIRPGSYAERGGRLPGAGQQDAARAGWPPVWCKAVRC